MRYAGIGSRKTPSDILERFQEIAENLARAGHVVFTGAAEGADTAFENGASRIDTNLVKLFIPWNGFSGKDESTKCLVSSKPCDGAIEIASKLLGKAHWDNMRLSYNSKYSQNRHIVPAHLLHARNIYQILGKDLNSPVDFVICWAPIKNKQPVGGTATAIKLAIKYSIPVYNFSIPSDRIKFEQFMKEII